MTSTRLAPALLCVGLIAVAMPAAAQYPEKPVRFVVPFASGTATDQIARALGQAMTAETGQQVIVDNKPGANGFIGANEAARAAPDGYTVFITTNTTHAAAEHLFKKLPYDPVKDFEPITLLGNGAQVMVVNAQSPYQSVADFLAAAKKEPNKLSFGSGSSSSRIAGELLQQLADVKILHVPYKSNTFAVTDLMGGQIDMMITDTATGLPHVKGGKLRALGMSTAKRSPVAPDIPTIAEAGVPNYNMSYWFAAYAPAKTPQPIIERLNALLAKASESETARTFYANSGVDRAVGSPADLAKFQQAESKKWEEIVRKAGIEKE